MFMISSYLSGESIKSLIQASWPFNRAFRDNLFWKRRIRQDILPWFWEVRTAFTELSDDTNDYRTLYYWLDHLTNPRLGVKGSIMPISNRRRIWKVCEVIKERYAKEFIPKMHANDEEDLMELESRQMPPLIYPKPSASSATWTHWTAEFAIGPGQLESFWNCNGDLVGLALNMRLGRKLLGKDDNVESWIARKAAPISAGDTITGFVLHVSDVVVSLEEDAETIARLEEEMAKNWAVRKHFKPDSIEYAASYKEVKETVEELEKLEKKVRPGERCKAAVKAITVSSPYPVLTNDRGIELTLHRYTLPPDAHSILARRTLRVSTSGLSLFSQIPLFSGFPLSPPLSWIPKKQ